MVQIEVLKKVHTSDIKDGVVLDSNLYTVGRDRRIQVTSLANLDSLWESPDLGAVVNSICERNKKIYAGLQTGEVLVYEASSDSVNSSAAENGKDGSASEGGRDVKKDKNNYSLTLISRKKVHNDNVCSLSVFSEGVISTSWDKTMGILREEKDAEIVSLESVAWSAKELPDRSSIIAGCIDGSVAIIKKVDGKYKKTRGLKVQATCIRDVLVEDGKYLTVSNTGVVIMAEQTGRTICKINLDNTSFRMSKYSVDGEQGYIVAADEGMVYLLNDRLEKVASIAIPSISCWSAISCNDKIAAFGGDGRIYVFGSTGSEKYQKEMEALQDALNSEKTKEDSSAKDQGSTNEAENKGKYKVVDDKVYELKDGVWELFGSTVEKKKKDHTITITLGERNYSLSFDKTEKYEEVADGFVRENGLSSEYIPEIVEFLNENFKKQKPRDVSKYFLYDTLDLENVSKRISSFQNSEKVIEFLKKVKDGKNIGEEGDSEIEVILSEWLESGTERVAVLDIYKYLISKGADFDLFFLKGLDVFSCNKIALVYTMISTNVLAMKPECRSLVENTVGRIIDRQLVNSKVIQNFKHNKHI
ncbi:phospholipase A-2-activating protein [Nematocida minor]|uniref:phospholipase A-2-activating protein n=1 Tax=Nematocida minor TaxID=1912983 RepID=UPI00222019B8|nr:phospholipase A-2-activating protein [Nematocida minor]KAI5190399.1 phospholipase A-2-activating protein [Nematocida minor]